jgi:hypothetical protein
MSCIIPACGCWLALSQQGSSDNGSRGDVSTEYGRSMITVQLAPYRLVWLWIGDLPAPVFEPDATVEHTLPVTGRVVQSTCAAAELSIIYGPRADYGMLGATFAPIDSTQLTIQIATSVDDPSARQLWQHSQSSTRATYPFGFIGLPTEYSDGVLQGVLDAPELERLGGGSLTFACAAHNPVDSNTLTFRQLARIVVRLLQADAQTLSHPELTEMVRGRLQS